MSTTPQTLDVSGLPPAAVAAVAAVVEQLRAAHPAPPANPDHRPHETHEQWLARLDAWIHSHPVRDIVIDDSRDTIYDRETE